ncbi:hypothetical protein PM082_003992 [Marasmius tenuissimus]|nr:hypothetical protein PM082_003992 [Marasmius tenuissimus]
MGGCERQFVRKKAPAYTQSGAFSSFLPSSRRRCEGRRALYRARRGPYLLLCTRYIQPHAIMVSVRKLKQMERNRETGTDSTHEGDLEADSASEMPSSSKITVNSASDSQSQRPFTRSQSGRPIKRRVRDDNALDSASQSTSPAKRPKVTRKRSVRKPQPKEEPKEAESEDNDNLPYPSDEYQTPAESEELARSTPPIDKSSDPSTSTSESSTVPSAQNSLPMRYGTNRVMRATLPTPVPNLTKKSRGRRVPTRVGAETPNSGGDRTDDKRSYVCSVEGCGKCFHRGEHLKRHIRSIHTHEKPFKCTFANCDKFFNRHDNLLQHIKVHKAYVASSSTGDEEPVEDTNKKLPRAVATTPATNNPLLSLAAAAVRPLQPAPTLHNVADPGYSTGSESTVASSTPSLFSSLRQTYTQMSLSSIGTSSYESSGDSSAFSTNMAVSSLRSTDMSPKRGVAAADQQRHPLVAAEQAWKS